MAISHGSFLGIGNPILVISSPVDDGFLQKYDITMNTVTLAEERHLHIYNELTDKYEPHFSAGGATANTVRVAQWMLGVPGVTAFMGCLGDDVHGQTLRHCISEDGVNAHFSEDPIAATGTSAVLLNATGERALVTNLSAANMFLPEHLETNEAHSFLADAKFVYIHGFFLMDNAQALMAVARLASESDKQFMMNLAAPLFMHYFSERVLAALPYCDFVFCNETEALAFGHMKGWGNDISKIALWMAALPKVCGSRHRVVVVTQGALETIVASNGKLATYPVDKLSNELLVDINGAGDAFVGGFVSRIIKGEKIGNCVRAGHWAARTVIQEQGCCFPKRCDFV